MSLRSHHRLCPRCAQELAGQQHQGAAGPVLVWKCRCGISAVRTVAHDEQAPPPRMATGLSSRVYIELAGDPQKARE